jgi:hypothetical protein
MTIAFVLGNGQSRLTLDLAQLAKAAPVYGCNALFREFEPAVLISTDAPISKAIQESGYSKQHVHYTRKPLPDLGAKRIPQQYYGFSSGPTAAGIAAIDRHRKIYLLGFDMGPTTTGHFNNVYSDTEFYKKSSATPTYTGNWVRQLGTVAKDFPKTQFVRVQGVTTASILELSNIPNLSHLLMVDFIDRINNTKDL